MNRKRAIVLAVMALFTFSATSAMAVDTKKITSYWGYYLYGGGTACYVLVGPSIEPEVIGQKVRECDGTTWTWGNTSCTYFTPTVEYEECGASATANETDKNVARPDRMKPAVKRSVQ